MSQTCSQCNAPLPLGPVGAITKCGYCGTDNRFTESASPPELERLVEKAVAKVGVGIRLGPERLTSDQREFFARMRANGESRRRVQKRLAWFWAIFFAVVFLFTAVAVIFAVLYVT